MAPMAKGPSGGEKKDDDNDDDGASNNNDNNKEPGTVGTGSSTTSKPSNITTGAKKKTKTTTKTSNGPQTTKKSSDTNNNKGLARTLDTLSREMAVAEYSKTKNGQYRRVTPKEVSLQKTRKRKALEKEDAAIAPGEYVEDDDNEATCRILDNVTETQTAAGATRLRGSKVSLEHAVVEGSLPLLAVAAGRAHRDKLAVDDEEDEEDLEEEEGGDNEEFDEEVEEGDAMDVDPEGEDDAGNLENDEGDEEEGNDGEDEGNQKLAAKESSPSNDNSQKESATKKRGAYKKKTKTTPRRQANSKKARRRLFRLKNFKSHRMAQRHGDALGAHARGQPVLAISLLKQVAKDAPSAPQVYSSLGMVYHDMFDSCWKKVLVEISSAMDNDDVENENDSMGMEIDGQAKDSAAAGNDKTDDATAAQNLEESESAATKEAMENKNNNTNTESTNNADSQQDSIIPPAFKEALDLAGKAYGSYHIAAILCKKDYALWVRAADAACDMAEIYQQIMIHHNHQRKNQLLEKNTATDASADAATVSATKDGLRIEADRATAALLDQCRQQQERWYNEAKNDYQVADNLKPPGLDIPIKLASVYMELGHFSEALTLWTDLLQRSSHTAQFRHTAWLLYAECMLHIGHKCEQWNAGIESTTKNYMFRRWLRKWSRTFDWQERRLQALVLALEAAAGSKACHQLMEWMRDRAQQQQRDQRQQAEAEEREQAAIAFAEALVDYNYRDGDPTAETVDKSHDEAKAKAGSDNSGVVTNAGDSTGETATEGGATEQKLDETQGGSQSNEVASSAVEESNEKDPLEEITSPADKESQGEGQSNEAPSPTNERNEGEDQSSEDTSPGDAAKAEFEAEKQLLLRNNEAELAAFDQTTDAMKEVYVKDKTKEGSADRTDALKERRDARRKLTRVHQAQVSRLEGEYQAKIEGGVDGGAEVEGENQDLASSSYLEERNIPIAASSRAVSKVAFELMKHMIDMGLYKGGRLAGEAVSLYMKERARICDKRSAARRRLNEQSTPFGALFGSSYDEVDDDGSSSEDEGLDTSYLSDEEELDSPIDGPRLLGSMRHGVLPNEISVLFSICMMYEGGRNFFAKKCMKSIDLLPQETRSWAVASDSQLELTKDVPWYLCHTTATEPFGRTGAYAYLADTLHKVGKEAEWAGFLAPLYSTLVDDLQVQGLTDILCDLQNVRSLSSRIRRRQILKSIHAWGRLQVIKAKEAYLKALETFSQDEARSAQLSVIEAFRRLKKYLNIGLSRGPVVEADGSMPDDFLQLLDLLKQGYALLAEESNHVIGLDSLGLEETAKEVGDIISWLCLANVPEPGVELQDSTIFDSTEWNEVPLPSSWQSTKHTAISLRCYNLCVSFNVSHFSGWESHEFSLRLMRSRANCTYFGLRIQDGLVTGFLPPVIEKELGQQWSSLGHFLPAAESFNFRLRLEQTKARPWYKEGLLKHNSAIADEPISVYAEQDGLEILLSHSKACLRLAKKKDSYERHDLLMTCMSIILPITQFCLDRPIWRSDIGRAATLDTGIEGWRQMSRKRVTGKKKSQSRTRTRLPKPPKQEPRGLEDWFPGEDRFSPLSNAISIPVRELQRLWRGEDQDSARKEADPAAQWAMRKVHEAMQKLRACYTESSVEKASLEVASALLHLVSIKDACENPFLCLQQAAIFASHGTKLGNSDDFFRERLPELSKCTPHEALVILGRADCFQSVYFPYEAAFLCSYIARACSLHRESAMPDENGDGEDEEEGGQKNDANKPLSEDTKKGTWNNQWMVVGILCYNVSTMIRLTASKVFIAAQQQLLRKEEFEPWDDDVIDELLMARSNGIAWKSAISKKDDSFSCESVKAMGLPSRGSSDHLLNDEIVAGATAEISVPTEGSATADSTIGDSGNKRQKIEADTGDASQPMLTTTAPATSIDA